MNIEEQLKLEYIQISNELKLHTMYIEIEVRNALKDLLYGATGHKKIEISTRIKDCQSSINSLKKKQEGRVFLKNESYSIKNLKDLIGIRVAVFPFTFLREVNELVEKYLNLSFDTPVENDPISLHDNYIVYKYSGVSKNLFPKYKCEIQVLPMLIGKFWDIEHDVFYKPENKYIHVSEAPPMKDANKEVINALYCFEKTFEEVSKK